MKAKAEKHLEANIRTMDDAVWQQRIHLQQLLARDDEQFSDGRGWDSRNLAVYAAALGWTRHSVNVKRS